MFTPVHMFICSHWSCVVQCANQEALQRYFARGIERMQAQCARADASRIIDIPSLLIKPVQRILKYPLLLNEIFKVPTARCLSTAHASHVFSLELLHSITCCSYILVDFKNKHHALSKNITRRPL